MSSTAITTVVTMLETLPEVLQIQVVEHLREYLADLQDEWQWDNSFQQTQASLSAAARQAKQERAALLGSGVQSVALCVTRTKLRFGLLEMPLSWSKR